VSAVTARGGRQAARLAQDRLGGRVTVGRGIDVIETGGEAAMKAVCPLGGRSA